MQKDTVQEILNSLFSVNGQLLSDITLGKNLNSKRKDFSRAVIDNFLNNSLFY